MNPEAGLRLLIAEYSRMAAAYDQHYAPYHTPMVRRIIESAALSGGDRILDLGCGTGVLTFEVALQIGPAGSAVGIDAAKGMIDVATVKVSRSGARNVRFARMDSRKLAFVDGAFDAVLSCFGIDSLGHLQSFREAHRVLRDGVRLVLCHWSNEGRQAPPVVGLLAEFRSKDLPEEVRRLLEARRSIIATGEPTALRNPETVIEELKATGFRGTDRLLKSERIVYPDPTAYLARNLAMGDNEREFRSMSPEVRGAFLREFEKRAAPFVTDEGLVAVSGVSYFVAQK